MPLNQAASICEKSGAQAKLAQAREDLRSLHLLRIRCPLSTAPLMQTLKMQEAVDASRAFLTARWGVVRVWGFKEWRHGDKPSPGHKRTKASQPTLTQ